MRTLLLALVFSAAAAGQTPAELYATHCAACHGVNMEGAQYTPLRKTDWRYGNDQRRVFRSVMYGIEGTDMPPWSGVLSEEQVTALVDHILESQDYAPGERPPRPDFLETNDYIVDIETLVAEGFRSSPWSIEFVDDRRALITERRGGLRWMVDGKLDPEPIEGVPMPTQYGDSGMYDLALHPNFGQNGWVYMAYVHPLGDGSSRDVPAMTRVVRGRVEGHRWVEQETVFAFPDRLHFARGSRWGSRLLFDKDGNLYFTIGDIGRNDDVQQRNLPAGKVFRIRADGSIPEDNPYAGDPNAIEAIFTIGNRNVQGIDQHPETGAVWAVEHGPMGGDELNILEAGKNYGWPFITYGLNYDGSVVSELTHKEGMEQPIKYWKPSPGLGPLIFYTGDLFPKWKNRALVGAMAFEEIKLLKLDEDAVLDEQIIMKNRGRVRDLQVGPEGAIYAVVNNPHSILRLTPRDNE